MTIISILLTSRTPIQELERGQEGGRSENDRETAPVSDSVPVRPGTSAENAVVPAVTDKDLDHKETDNGLCHHNRVAVRL